MSFGFLALGCLFVVSGVAYLAYLMGIPETMVVVPVLVILGVGGVTSALSGVPGSRRTRI